ncbi:MAG TPA: GGDEF domain-containing protein [Eubacteriales bacterium]|nr:GGDEF domain-containing protein [Eubacteriales bacterium]
MQNALYIEISLVGIAILAIVLFNQRGNVGSSSLQRQFNRMVYATIAILVIDAACWLVDGTTFPYARNLNYFFETLYYAFNILMPFLWVVYSETALEADAKAARAHIRILAVPMAVFTALLFFNLKYGMIFEIDAQNVYHRGSWFFLDVLLSFAYLGYASFRALAKALKYRRSLRNRQYYMMAAFIVPPAIGGVLQTMFYGLSCIWICTVISVMLYYIDSLNRQISTEPLTGLNNRRELNKYLTREARDAGHTGVLAMIMMDIDRFKEVNDTYGHYYGDTVLIAMADILKKSCKSTSAFLARIGGDEFCIIYPADNIEVVEGLIAKIQYNIIIWNAAHKDMIPLSLSIGYSVWDSENDKGIDALYRRADQKMYEAKRAKRMAA